MSLILTTDGYECGLEPLRLGLRKHCETTVHTPDIASMAVQFIVTILLWTCGTMSTCASFFRCLFCFQLCLPFHLLLQSVLFPCDGCAFWFYFLVSYFLSMPSFLLAHFLLHIFLQFFFSCFLPRFFGCLKIFLLLHLFKFGILGFLGCQQKKTFVPACLSSYD